MSTALQTTPINPTTPVKIAPEAQPANNTRIHQSPSAPELKSILKTDPPTFVRLAHSAPDLRTPSKRISFKRSQGTTEARSQSAMEAISHSTTADSFRVATLYFDTMHQTILELLEEQASHISIDEIKDKQCIKLNKAVNDLKHDRKRKYPERIIPQCWRKVEKINSKDGVTSKISDLLFDALVSLASEQHDEEPSVDSTSTNNTDKNLTGNDAEIDYRNKLSNILTVDKSDIVLALAERFEDNKSKYIALPTNPSPERRDIKLDDGGKKIILSPAERITKKHFDTLYHTGSRLALHQEMPPPGEYYIARKSKKLGANPGSNHRKMEKVPRVDQEVARAHYINTKMSSFVRTNINVPEMDPELARAHGFNTQFSAVDKTEAEDPTINDAELEGLFKNKSKELCEENTIEEIESKYPNLFLEEPKGLKKIPPYMGSRKDMALGKAHIHHHETHKSITVHHLGKTTVIDKKTKIKTITERDGTVKRVDQDGNIIETPEMKEA